MIRFFLINMMYKLTNMFKENRIIRPWLGPWDPNKSKQERKKKDFAIEAKKKNKSQK